MLSFATLLPQVDSGLLGANLSNLSSDPADIAVRCLPEPVTDREFSEVEYNLNVLSYAYSKTLELRACFLDRGVSRQIVEDFFDAFERAEGCSLYNRITALCNALHIVLQSINVATGGQYRDLEDYIFSRARYDSSPPKKFRHRHLDRTKEPQMVYKQLKRMMDTLIMLTSYRLYASMDGQPPQGSGCSNPLCQPAQA